MRKPYGIATVATVLLGTGVVAWWGARENDSDARRGTLPVAAATAGPAAAGPAVTREAAGVRQAPSSGQETAGQEAEAEPTTPRETPVLTAERAITDHNTATRGPRQPIPFSHKFHVTELRIECAYCHAGTERSSMGVVPPLEVCMGCHRTAGTGLEPIEELRGYWSRNEPVPWEWVNKLPDFVQFSHRAHLRNEIACESCHGPIADMDRVYQWAPLTMGWCLECHRSGPEADDVATDHRLALRSPPREPPRERQERSLYPTTIDQRYAAFRAPVDCLICHY